MDRVRFISSVYQSPASASIDHYAAGDDPEKASSIPSGDVFLGPPGQLTRRAFLCGLGKLLDRLRVDLTGPLAALMAFGLVLGQKAKSLPQV